MRARHAALGHGHHAPAAAGDRGSRHERHAALWPEGPKQMGFALMTSTEKASGPLAAVYRLRAAINAHDLDAIVDCFAPDFRSELPAFPDASFTGNENVRRIWGMLLSSVPDMAAEVVRSTCDEDTVWAEWQQQGTQTDGRPHLARGIIIFWIADGRIASNRFYVHPVSKGAPSVLDG
jgi:ketosteroid isomerase-like protein